MSQVFTSLVKQHAYSLGADLVGVANIERWENAPLLMSPLGLMPDGRSVLVCAVHHTDAMIEIGGESTPHELGSYSYQYYMNNKLDYLSYRLGCFLEDHGYRAIPITASNIWRYREYKGLKSVFAPDMSHIYASVCAGLSEMGYHGLAMTPEYGARNRFVSIVSDAPLLPDPLLPGDTLCDNCGQCISHCLTKAFTHEVDGKVSLKIEDKTYSFANKNLWRCAWSEHFGLDGEAEIPAKVDEAATLKRIKEAGLRGGTMGCCLKFCLPRDKRSWDKSYSSAPIRKKNVVPNRPDPDRGVQQRLLSHAFAEGAERVLIQDMAGLQAKYGDLKAMLPDAKSLVWVLVKSPLNQSERPDAKLSDSRFALGYNMNEAVFYYASELEKLGYSGAPYAMGAAKLEPMKSCYERIQQAAKDQFGELPPNYVLGFALTSAELKPTDAKAEFVKPSQKLDLSETVKRVALEQGADLAGISSVQRLSKAVDSIKAQLDGQQVFNAKETGRLWLSSIVEVEQNSRQLHKPEEHLKGAKSVIVLGKRTPAESSECLGRRPAEAIGPYVFGQYESHRFLERAALALVRRLEAWGYKNVILRDLENSGSDVSNPRGSAPNMFANRISAVCAGLGTLTKGGFVNTAKFNTNARFIAIVTDAELRQDELADLQALRSLCEDCQNCLQSCNAKAYIGEASLQVDDVALPFHYTEQSRCDWALRYGLLGSEGNQYTGSKTNVPLPDKVTAENLAAAMEQRDPIVRIRPCSAEMCSMACPYTRMQMEA
ncbi:MAG: hypothetical protein PHG44_06225 [Lentisphaeria bacterium]|nr:hypothetical protein [Lentisphaeria bacterium]MDY0175334.1 hypothetical protein [Lentisphaeria bacterium]NLZ60712.1 hypothetical protein [Lentisphaerota bacterium]